MDEEMRKKKGKWPPHKVVAQECQMQVACKVLYLDMVGHADNLAHEKLVELAAPQRLVVVHGHPSATANFTAVSRARGLSKFVHAPQAGVTTEFPRTPSYVVALSKELISSMSNLAMVGNDGAQVTAVSGVLRQHKGQFVLQPLPLNSDIFEFDDNEREGLAAKIEGQEQKFEDDIIQEEKITQNEHNNESLLHNDEQHNIHFSRRIAQKIEIADFPR